MTTVASGFETSLIESIAVISIIIALVVFFVVYGLHKQRQREHARELAGAQRYRELVQRHQLTPSEEDLIQQLVDTLKRSREAYRLLESQGRFNRAAAELLSRETVTAGQISALRVKLGYTGRPIGLQPHSSVDIPLGAVVRVEQRRAGAQEATVTASPSNSLCLRVEEDSTAPAAGTQLRVVYQNESGVFAFSTVVLIREGVHLFLQHSEEIEKQQQRNHYRRTMQLPVRVYPQITDEDPLESECIDLGGGGASLYNPDTRFEAGDTLYLGFDLPEGDPIELPATVIRTSRKRTVLHVRYGNIREAQRDRIYRMLFYTS